MTICPHTQHQCHCQPDEGIMCPYGPMSEEEAQPMTQPKYMSWPATILRAMLVMLGGAIGGYIGVLFGWKCS